MNTSGATTHWAARFLPVIVILCFLGCGISPRREVVSAAQGGTGNIVFTSARALDGSDSGNATTNIWQIASDGSSARALTTLTAAGAVSASPVWSPNAAKIAFESMRALDGSNTAIPVVNIWVMNADGSNQAPLTRITAQPVTSLHSAWSPDNTKIAYDSTRALDGSNAAAPIANIWVVNADGTGSKALTTLTASLASSVSPVWSPDGTKILFVSSRALNGFNAAISARNIWIMNADGTNTQPLTRLTTTASFDPAWSPDGKKIAFVSARALDGSDTPGTAANIWVINADGSGATPITRLTTLFNLTVETPLWSPDGARIIYTSSRAIDGSDAGGSVLNIWSINPDGSNSHPLTAQVAAFNQQPAWSADGTKIIFCSTRSLDGSDTPNTHATLNLWLMNSDGSGVHPLTKNVSSGSDSAGPQWMR